MVVVLGLGHIGKVAALALTKLGNKVQALDKDHDTIARCKERNKNPKIHYIQADYPVGYLQQWKDLKDIDCLLSCLPYHQNLEIAKFCISNEIAYADLGGDEPIESQIKALAVNAKALVFPSLGLAPGLISIITEHLIEKHGVPKEVYMYVGGLPQNTFNGSYQRTWSVEGLVNNYKKGCQILTKGEIKDVAPLTGYQQLDTGYEAFYTSGGMSYALESLRDRGVTEASYRTIRYKGHREQVLPLVDKLDEKECIDLFTKVFPITKEDKVRLRVEMRYWDSGTVRVVYQHEFYSDWIETAMQKTTAYSAAAVVHMLVNNDFKGLCGWSDVSDNRYLVKYSDIDFNIFSSHLSRLGLLP